MSPRFYVDDRLHAGAQIALPAGAARHVQVLRLQPGAPITLFNGDGGEWDARVRNIGRTEVQVDVGIHHALDRELPLAVTLALGMPANERMDTLVEKATELGAAAIQPLLTERSVLRLAGERAQRRREHWQAIAVAACEQCGRTRVPQVLSVQLLSAWLSEREHAAPSGWLLSPADDAIALVEQPLPQGALCMLSGPEGGLSTHETDAARAAGFVAVGLGPRILRADTAPLAALAYVALRAR
jgi:16S rRNA (uracil1498-N3)-methyltransferase